VAEGQSLQGASAQPNSATDGNVRGRLPAGICRASVQGPRVRKLSIPRINSRERQGLRHERCFEGKDSGLDGCDLPLIQSQDRIDGDMTLFERSLFVLNARGPTARCPRASLYEPDAARAR